MNKVELNLEMINSRISAIREALDRLNELKKLKEEDFLKDYRNYNAAENLLRHALESIFDIGRHILAKINSLNVDFEYKTIARRLVEKRIVDSSLRDSLINMAGYRNRLTHFYHDVTSIEIYNVIQKHLGDIEKFLKDVTRFISKQTL